MNTSNQTSTHEDGTITSGKNLSCWFTSNIEPLSFEKLNENIDTDVLVIGGGISGLTTAYCLAKEGKKVVLVEDGCIGSGETGRTTAHLSCALDEHYFEIEKTFNTATMQLAADSHMAAINWIANTVKHHEIACHYKKVNGYLFLHPSDIQETLDKEYEATIRAGLTTELLQSVPSVAGEEGQLSIKFSNQGQFHILLYLKGLADAFIKFGGKIYTQTKAEDITDKGAKANGFTVKANHIVVATNTPINDWVTMHTKLWPYRTYAIAVKVAKGKLPYALWWDTGDQDSKWITKPYHYVRLEAFDENYDLLIAGGEDHRTGQADDEDIKEEDRYANLEKWTRKHFPDIETIEYKWSGQVMEPIDSLAYIGKNPGDDNIYIITGDSGNGMTHGTLGGIIITDLINGRKNPWTEIYSPSRITLNTTGDYLSEVGNMVAQFVDWFTPENVKEVSDLKLGEGGIIVSGMKKIAVYRDEHNKLHSSSAVCPHLGGILQWNADEKTFDCPLHGSRFTTDGKVINGPASTNLEKQTITDS
ncbi:FAD-dependent oxidoreductase [Flavobacterium sp. F372]|uniref:FAD-dependent oxidoreductase n=1 Tax=Flavobacterium bernardetii TaxID=2813823 RepID=A0ABR7IVD7_9FLAO|nr:FAD-dependent oxidoreductase [Flavobacterium bernardetii]MBC5833693.1 FAD-dependent oxidoreductase [Flavobacterium bernardetii]NHF68926.1 FAD-dependent oxidoreductase [Flavobacterium bernardetii]